MKRSLYVTAALAVALGALTRPPDAIAQAPDPAPAIDPDAMAALTKMGSYLRTLTAFQIRAAITTEEVLESGEKVQLTNAADLVARKPDRLRLDVTSDRKSRLFLYDGKNFTLFARRMGYYATVAAPPTIGELAKKLEDTYGIDLPLVDLFRWGTPESSAGDITGARDIGPSVVDGITCEQYAFRQNGLDWQIWIQQGEFPLPKKLVLTTLTDDARPQYMAEYTWNLAPSFDEKTFVFDAPPDAKKIPLVDITTIKSEFKKVEKPK